MTKAKNKIDVMPGSGNVFADLGLANANEKQTKVHLAVAINQIIRQGHLSQTAAAEVLNVNQLKISALANFHLEGFSVERLMQFLNALGSDVEIIIRKARSHRGARIVVTDASLAFRE